MQRRKANVWILAIVLGIPMICFVLVWPLPQPPETPVNSTFLGFTNETAATMALFSARNLPSGPTPELRAIAYKQGWAWKSQGVPPGMFVRYAIDTNDFTRIIMALPVAATNQPTRFIFEFPGR